MLARLAYMQSCGLWLCFPVAMTAVVFLPFSLLAVYSSFFFFCFLSFFSFFSFSGETKNTLLHDGNHYGLLSLGSMFCILYSRRDSASLWLEVGSLSCLCGNSAPWPQLLLGLWYGTEARLELSVPGLVLLGRPGRFFSLMWLSTWFLAETISVE